MSQNRKRKKKPVAADAGQTVTAAKTAAQLKKEKKAEAERIKKENQTKRKRCYAASVVVAFLAVVLSFWSGSFYGQPIYAWLQVLCYVLMGSCGAIMMVGSRWEELEKKKQRMHTTGIVFVMMALGMCLAQLVQIWRG